MRKLIVEAEPWEKTHFDKYMKGNKLTYMHEPLTAENVHKAANAEIISIFIHTKMNASLISKLPKLKCLITRSVGYDHIDLKACKKRKISVYNIPDYGISTVAEHTFALMLALSRKIPAGVNRTKQGSFHIEGLQEDGLPIPEPTCVVDYAEVA